MRVRTNSEKTALSVLEHAMQEVQENGSDFVVGNGD